MAHEYKKSMENWNKLKSQHLGDLNWTCAQQRFVGLKYISELGGTLRITLLIEFCPALCKRIFNTRSDV